MNSTYAAIKIILIYLIMGFTWIITSDLILDAIFPDPETNQLAQTAKGIFYVAFTAIIFFYIIHRQMDMYVMTILDLKKAYVELDEGHKKSLQLEDQLYDLAYYDPLTGLPNRIMLEQTINRYINEKKIMP